MRFVEFSFVLQSSMFMPIFYIDCLNYSNGFNFLSASNISACRNIGVNAETQIGFSADAGKILLFSGMSD